MMICPKCKSMEVVKSGSVIRSGGSVQSCQCKKCGYKGPEEKFVVVVG